MEAKEQVNAKKEKYQEPDALKLLDSATYLFAAKGKKVVKLNLKKDEPAQEEILKLVLGPTGNLRAPTLRMGKKLVVGFNADLYAELLG